MTDDEEFDRAHFDRARFDRARFDESLELAHDQLALHIEVNDEDRERE